MAKFHDCHSLLVANDRDKHDRVIPEPVVVITSGGRNQILTLAVTVWQRVTDIIVRAVSRTRVHLEYGFANCGNYIRYAWTDAEKFHWLPSVMEYLLAA